MDDHFSGQVTGSAAEVYEEFFVPALFQEWAPRVAEAARLMPGQKALDVACGTGVLAREASTRVYPGGSVTGIDCNRGMLEVARRMRPGIEWYLGRAESLPFPGNSFDAVVSQFGLMFFQRPIDAVREMWRVLRPGGRFAAAVWDALDRAPGYAAMSALLHRLFGDRVAEQLRAPFSLGAVATLRSIFADAGIPSVEVHTMDGLAHFPSLESWVHTDVRGWTLADLIDDARYRTLLREAETELAPFVQRDGTVAFFCSAHIVTSTKR